MPVKALKSLWKTTWEHSQVGFNYPSPCVRLRKGADKEFLKTFFNPIGGLQVEVGTLLQGTKTKKVRKVKKQPFKDFCLFKK